MRKLMKKKVNVFGKAVPVFVLVLLGVGLVSAALIQYWGVITGSVFVNQGLKLDGKDWDDTTITYSKSLTSLETETVSSGKHTLANGATVDATVTLDTVCEASEENGCEDLVDKMTAEYVLSASGDKGTESRIHIRAEDVSVDSLNDLASINWESFVEDGGYIAHVDVLIDIDNDGVKDDALVFEYDKEQLPSDQLVVNMAFVKDTWTTNAFDNKGSIDATSIAWLSSACSGDVTNPHFIHGSLTDWKTGITRSYIGCPGVAGDDALINGDTKVIGFEIEIDNWIVDTNAKIRNIQINTVDVNEVTVLAGEELDFQIVTDFPKMMKPAEYTITTTVTA